MKYAEQVSSSILKFKHICPGIRASGDGELRAEGSDRRAPYGEAAANGNAQSPPAHLHREDRQCENTRERGQPPAGAAVRRNQMKPGNKGRGFPEAQTSTIVAAI